MERYNKCSTFITIINGLNPYYNGRYSWSSMVAPTKKKRVCAKS